MNVDEKAHELSGRLAPVLEREDRVELLSEALREARHDAAQQALAYAAQETNTILGQHDVDPLAVSSLHGVLTDASLDPSPILESEGEERDPAQEDDHDA